MTRGGEWVLREVKSGVWEGLVVLDGAGGAERASIEVPDVDEETRIELCLPGPDGRGALLVLSVDNEAACASTGEKKVLWRFPTRGEVTAVSEFPFDPGSGKRVLVGNRAGDLFCLRAEDGSLAWARRTGRPVLGIGYRRKRGTPTGEILVLGSRTASLLSRDAARRIWEITLPDAVSVTGAPAFRHLWDIDGDGLDDLIVPLEGGRILGIRPGERPYREREIDVTPRDRLEIGTWLVQKRRQEAGLGWLEGVVGEPSVEVELKARALREAASAMEQIGRREEALKAFDAAVALDAGNAALLLERGVLLSALKRFEDAERDFSAVLDAAKADRVRSALAYHRRGRARMAQGKHREAADDFSKHLELYPGSVEILLARAGAMHALERWDAVVADCDAALEKNRWSPEAHVLRARALCRLGKAGEALDALKMGVKAGFKDARLLRNDPDFETIRDRAEFGELADVVDGLKRGKKKE